jgi:hypothetical protein
MIICIYFAMMCVALAICMDWPFLIPLSVIFYTISSIRYRRLQERIKDLELRTDGMNFQWCNVEEDDQ